MIEEYVTFVHSAHTSGYALPHLAAPIGIARLENDEDLIKNLNLKAQE